MLSSVLSRAGRSGNGRTPSLARSSITPPTGLSQAGGLPRPRCPVPRTKWREGLAAPRCRAYDSCHGEAPLCLFLSSFCVPLEAAAGAEVPTLGQVVEVDRHAVVAKYHQVVQPYAPASKCSTCELDSCGWIKPSAASTK